VRRRQAAESVRRLCGIAVVVVVALAGLLGFRTADLVADSAAARTPTTVTAKTREAPAPSRSTVADSAAEDAVATDTSSISEAETTDSGETSTESAEPATTDSTTSPPTVTGITPSQTGTGARSESAPPAGASTEEGGGADGEATLESLAVEPARLPRTAEGLPILERLTASPARFVSGSDASERGTTLTFSVAAPGRLEFSVLGKAPQCRRLGTFSRKVRRGVNRIRFTGRLRGRLLPPGTYTIVPELVRGRQRTPLASVTVVILPTTQPPSAATEAPPRAECVPALVRAAVASDSSTATSGGHGTGSEAGSTGQSTAEAETPSGNRSGVAGVSTAQGRDGGKSDPLADLPVLSLLLPDDPPGPPYVVGVAALLGVVFGTLILLALVLRFMRRAWNP
jgi:hypothetical protein